MARLNPACVAFDLGRSSDTTRRCWVRVYDTGARKWLQPFSIEDYHVMFPLDGEQANQSVVAADGGLVCLVRHACAIEEDELGPERGPIVVLNPLTRQWRNLPLNREVRIFMTLQLRVDRDTGMYKIFIVGYVSVYASVKPEAEVYDSSSNEWSTLSSGLILGDGPQVYDCLTGQFRWYYPPPRGQWRETEKYHLNDLYILERLTEADPEDETPYVQFALCKYDDGNWRFGRDGSPEVARPPAVYECQVQAFGKTSLFASGSFFMVYEHDPERPENGFQMSLYDVKKGEWHSQGNRVYTLIPKILRTRSFVSCGGMHAPDLGIIAFF